MKDKEKHIFYRDVQDVLELISGRWRGAIMASLCDDPKRFSELKEDLSPITSKILIKELRFLEENMLIDVQRDANGKSILYSHSEHGRSCGPIIVKLRNWGIKHRKIMMEIMFPTTNK